MSTEAEAGYVDSSQRLLQVGGRKWDQAQLLEAAKRGQLPHTGWPIGVVLEPPDVRPRPMADGIEATLGQEDYWAFKEDSSYYVFRQFEENSQKASFTSSLGHPERPIFFDTRILRIVELLIHSTTLYRSLGIPPDEPYLLSINHGGIRNREFYVNTMDWHVRRGRVCKVPAAEWTREVTQDYAITQLKPLVEEIANGLFVLFDFAKVENSTLSVLVDRFLDARLARGWSLP
ncbi:MAG: hypothetical protein IH956_07100 [Chloroflexi bacterium]|nr:hypothetical protein [Chloroflexota bacterium]